MFTRGHWGHTSAGHYTTPQQEAHFLIIPKMVRKFQKDKNKIHKREEIHRYIKKTDYIEGTQKETRNLGNVAKTIVTK